MPRPAPTEERLHLLVAPGTKARLTRLARERGLTMSALVRRLLAGLERIEPVAE